MHNNYVFSTEHVQCHHNCGRRNTLCCHGDNDRTVHNSLEEKVHNMKGNKIDE